MSAGFEVVIRASCPRCRGDKGWYEQTAVYESDGSMGVDVEAIICPVCDGTGVCAEQVRYAGPYDSYASAEMVAKAYGGDKLLTVRLVVTP